MIDLTLHRLHRFRDDIDWLVFDHAPTLDDLGTIDAWVDPAASEADFDGFVAEALAAGLAVVATRTSINLQRTEKGRTALLVPSDPNELTHAILAALFKAEVLRPRIDAARQTISKFRAKHRIRILAQIFETLGK
jgi:glycosyltransferase involved in cell wall biosynthesis